MKVVLDANIFISSLYWGGNPRRVLERSIHRIDELYITREIMVEIENVLKRKKFHADINTITLFMELIERVGNKIIPKEKISNASRDKTDDKYIECATESSADYIISGDIHLLEIKEYKGIKILNAADYLEIMRKGNENR
jgi:putative PIN family toxin of toxin-antitoxin system